MSRQNILKYLAILLFIVAIITTILEKYQFALMYMLFCVISVSYYLILLLLPNTSENDEDKKSSIFIDIMIVGIFLIPVLVFFEIQQQVIQWAFKDKPKQEICGVFERQESRSSGRSTTTYYTVYNHQTKQSLEFIRVKKYDIYQLGDKICVKYAIDERWQNTPYIYSVTKDFQN